jgi:hypothetical protein
LWMINGLSKKLGRKLEIHRFKWKGGHNLLESVRHSKGNLKREVSSHECPHQKIRGITNK